MASARSCKTELNCPTGGFKTVETTRFMCLLFLPFLEKLQAIEIHAGLDEQNKGHPLTAFLLGTFLVLDGQIELGNKHLQASVDIYSYFPEAHNNLGVSYELMVIQNVFPRPQ